MKQQQKLDFLVADEDVPGVLERDKERTQLRGDAVLEALLLDQDMPRACDIHHMTRTETEKETSDPISDPMLLDTPVRQYGVRAHTQPHALDMQPHAPHTQVEESNSEGVSRGARNRLHAAAAAPADSAPETPTGGGGMDDGCESRAAREDGCERGGAGGQRGGGGGGRRVSVPFTPVTPCVYDEDSDSVGEGMRGDVTESHGPMSHTHAHSDLRHVPQTYLAPNTYEICVCVCVCVCVRMNII